MRFFENTSDPLLDNESFYSYIHISRSITEEIFHLLSSYPSLSPADNPDEAPSAALWNEDDRSSAALLLGSEKKSVLSGPCSWRLLQMSRSIPEAFRTRRSGEVLTTRPT
jgi:hypothetical protein